MAFVDHINTGTQRIKCINLSESVGFTGRNRFGDVLVIQGMLRLLNAYSPSILSLGNTFALPEMTGEMDLATGQAINQFQIMQSRSLLFKYFDGLIEPAKYKGRILSRFNRGPGVKYLTITYMHILAVDAALMNGGGDYIEALQSMDVRIMDELLINS